MKQIAKAASKIFFMVCRGCYFFILMMGLVGETSMLSARDICERRSLSIRYFSYFSIAGYDYSK